MAEMTPKFERIYPYGRSTLSSYSYGNISIEHNIAHTLLDFGVQDVQLCTYFLAGHEDTHHVDIWFNNIQCSPRINVLYKGETTPLLWAIARSLDIVYSGCSGESYMQIGCSSDAVERSRVSGRYTSGELFLRIYAYFHAMKRFLDK